MSPKHHQQQQQQQQQQNKNQLNQLCDPLACLYIKGIAFNLNDQLYNHVQITKNKKLSHLKTSRCCCIVDSVAARPSHQDQYVVTSTDCDAAVATDGPCKNQTVTRMPFSFRQPPTSN